MKYSITVFDANEATEEFPGTYSLVEALDVIKVLNRSCILNEMRVWHEIQVATATTIAKRVEKRAFGLVCHFFGEDGAYVGSHDENDRGAPFEFKSEEIARLEALVGELV